MDKKEARKILGVTKETSRNDIERKYSILLKKHRAASLPPDKSEEDAAEEGTPESNASQAASATTRKEPAAEEYSFDQITEAYNVLMGYEVAVKEEPPSKVAPLLKKAGIDEKKARNFFYYYKFYILGALALVVALFFGIRSFVNRVEPDFNIAFLGTFSYLDSVDKLSKDIKQNIPEIKEPGIDGAMLTTADMPDEQQSSGNQPSGTQQQGTGTQPTDTGTQQTTGGQNQTDPQQQYAMEMKAMVLIAAGDVDVFIVDRDRYEKYAKQGVFLSLDDIAPKLGADAEKNKELITSIEEDKDPLGTSGTKDNQSADSGADASADKAAGDSTADVQPHLYGIDVSNSTVLKETGVLGEEKIAAIFVGSKRTDKAEKFIQYLMK